MFLTVKQNTIPDFLSALGFIVPKGMNMSYILAPKEISQTAVATLENEGFNESPIEQVKDHDVKYLKKNPSSSFSFSPREKLLTNPEIMPQEFPREDTVEETLSEPIEIKLPNRAIQIVEASNNLINGVSYLLKENYCGMPKNTLFAFSRGV